MSRNKMIDAGKAWHVYLDAEPDNVLFEGCKTKAFAFIKQTFGMRRWRSGYVRIGKVIWEGL